MTSEEALTLPVTGEEVVSDAPKSTVIPAQFEAKFKEFEGDIEVKTKTIKTAEKELEKIKTSNASKIEKATEKVESAEAKAKKDEKNPVHLVGVNKSKSDLNLVKKEAIKAEKAATSAVNKAVESKEKAVTAFDKLKVKISEFNAKDDAKKAAKAKKAAENPAASTKEITKLSRSKMIFLLIGNGWTVKEILEANPDFEKSHTTNCFQSYKAANTPDGNTLFYKAKEVADKLKIPIPSKPEPKEEATKAVTDKKGKGKKTEEAPKVEGPTVAVSGEVKED
jgi:hypothetical protein